MLSIFAKSRGRTNLLAWGLLAAVLLFVAAIRFRLLGIPLERDEGEFAYMGQLMLRGIPPYVLAYNMKLPGIYAVYALIMAVFGQTIQGIHIGLLTANVISAVLVFLLAGRLLKPTAAVVAGTSFAVLAVSPTVLGTSAHATHFILPFALSGIILMLKAISSTRPGTFFLSGLLLGMGFLVKQPAAAFIIFAVLYVLWSMTRNRPVNWSSLARSEAFLAAGAVAPFLLTCLIMSGLGIFDRFWFWTFTYAREYAVGQPISVGLANLFSEFSTAVGAWVGLWIIGLVGLIASLRKQHGVFLAAFLGLSFLSVLPGMRFHIHYFVLMLPAVAILIGSAVHHGMCCLPNKTKTVPLLLFVLFLAMPIYYYRVFFFQATPVEACRMIYGGNPFPESLEIAEYIRTRSSKDDLIAVIGSEPQIYFYTGRNSATGYIYTYALMEEHPYASKMQRDMIHEIEEAGPEYLVLVNVFSSWLPRERSDLTILQWSDYYGRGFDVVGIVDLLPEGPVYSWDEEVEDYVQNAPDCIYVLKRRHE